jgi:hypothetical protein
VYVSTSFFGRGGREGLTRFLDDVEWFHSRPDFKTLAKTRVRALPFSDPTAPNQQLLQLIYSTNILTLYKDVVFGKVIDDGNHSTLSVLIMGNSVDIVRIILDDSEYLSRFFSNFQSSSSVNSLEGTVTPLSVHVPESMDLAVVFVKELSTMAKSLPQPERLRFYKVLIHFGLFRMFDWILSSSPSVSTRVSGTTVLSHMVELDYSLFPIDHFGMIVTRLCEEKELGLVSQLWEIGRALLVNPGMVDEFYKVYASNLIDLISGKEDEFSAMQTQNVLDLLCFCVKEHVRCKMFVVESGVLERVVKLFDSRLMHVRLGEFFFGVEGLMV